MNGVVIIVVIILALIAGLGVVAYVVYQRKLRRAKAIERGLKMVPLLIHLPPPSEDTDAGGRDVREVMREKTSQAEVLYSLIAGTAQEGFKSKFYGQRHIAFEIVATDGLIHYYAAVPVGMVPVVQNAIISSYPGARIEEAEDHNIFSEKGKLFGTMGGEMVLKADAAYPIATYAQMERDPMEALLSAMNAIEAGGGAAVQILLRPADKSWVKRSEALSKKKRKVRGTSIGFSAADLAKAAVKAPSDREANKPELSNLELSKIEAIENKTKQPGFEVLIRVLVSTDSVSSSQALLQKIATAFALFEQPGLNGFKYLPASNTQGLVTAFILRFFPPVLKDMVLNTEEIATLFHIPDSQFIPTSSLERQQSKQVDGPSTLPQDGLLLGYNEFRGVKKEIRLSVQDRRRHTYIIGQTGTGKSTMLENLVVQDMKAGNGFAFIDPHGDTADKFMGLIPKERAEDVIYFNPGDMADPLGLNLFEFTDPTQKDFLIQESLSMLYKIYDPEHTGIIGPRFEQWYRNAALTLMADPNGATFIEIPKVFTDTEYLKNKFKYLKDPTVIDFWTKEMGQTSDYHKSEMLGFFVSKFGAFQQNEMMRNIIGQTQSAFNMREIMDKKKILIVNLSKGKIGEMNSKLLGMMFVIKFQAAAMSRGDMPEEQRNDFSLYVDEFQNFSTDSFASILSEARKYRLNLIVANQFIGQLTPEIRDAVFGNIGTIISHRTGPEDAEFMVKQFAPIFDARDLVNIPNYKSAVKLLIGGLPSQPFSMDDLPPVAGANIELGEAMKELSAAKYGRPRAQVESEITARLTNKIVEATAIPTPTPMPTSTATPVHVPVPVTNVSEPQPAPVAQPVVNTVPVPAPMPVAVPVPVPAPDTLSFSDIKKPVPPVAKDSESLPMKEDDSIIDEAQKEIDSLLGTSVSHSAEVIPDKKLAEDAKPDIPATPVTLPGQVKYAPRGLGHTVDHANQLSKPAEAVAPVAAVAPTIEAPNQNVFANPIKVEPPIVAVEVPAELAPVAEQTTVTDVEAEVAPTMPVSTITMPDPVVAATVLPSAEPVMPEVSKPVSEAAVIVPEAAAAPAAPALADALAADLAGVGAMAPPATDSAQIPPLAPGEIFVDDNGIVHQG